MTAPTDPTAVVWIVTPAEFTLPPIVFPPKGSVMFVNAGFSRSTGKGRRAREWRYVCLEFQGDNFAALTWHNIKDHPKAPPRAEGWFVEGWALVTNPNQKAADTGAER